MKIDFKNELMHRYQPSAKEVVEDDVPAMDFLTVDGEGDPNNSTAFEQAVEALFPVSYAAKLMVKKGSSAIDYFVMPLEALRWADDMSSFSTQDKTRWKWTVMIMQPPPAAAEIVAKAIADTRAKKNLPAPARLRFETLAEGRRAQVPHIGPFSTEGPTVERVHQFIRSRGGQILGKHHEIYLSDIRKADPQRWKTVVRQPMR